MRRSCDRRATGSEESLAVHVQTFTDAPPPHGSSQEARSGPARAGTWVALLESMNSPDPREENPGLDGPDYLALVIEWDDDSDVATIVRPREPRHTPVSRKIAAVVGALVAIGFATWGLHRLRTS